MPRKNKSEYNAYMAEYMTKRYHTRRNAYLATQGNKCAQCGGTEQLEIDHIEATGKSFNVAKAFSGWSQARLDAELLKCQVLCNTCHIAKSKANGDYRKR